MSARVLELAVDSGAVFRGLRAAKERLWASHNVGTLLVGTRQAILIRKGVVVGIPTHPIVLISRVAGRGRTLRIRSLPHPVGAGVGLLLGGGLLLLANVHAHETWRAQLLLLLWIAAHPIPSLVVCLVLGVLESLRRSAKHGEA